MSSLQSSLRDPPENAVKHAIIECFWNKNIPVTNLTNYDSYFRYYNTESRRMQFGLLGSAQRSLAKVALTHEDIIFVVRTLSAAKDSRRQDIRSSLKLRFQIEDAALNERIDLSLRLWLTLNIRHQDLSLQTPQTPTIQWNEQSSLRDFVSQAFPRATISKDIRLDHDFIAINIDHISGVKIEWTSSLQDHLRFDRGRRIVKIYRFKEILLDHLALSENTPVNMPSGERSIIPASVLKETLLSLNLLFPHWDERTDIFLRRQGQNFHEEPPFHDPRPLTLGDFDHWRSRVLELYQVFQAPPKGWNQIWADRRNSLQWYTFWLALLILILTVVFGIISSVTGVIQTCIAYQSLELARSQST